MFTRLTSSLRPKSSLKYQTTKRKTDLPPQIPPEWTAVEKECVSVCVCALPLEVKQGPGDAGGCFEGWQQLFTQLHSLSTEYLRRKERQHLIIRCVSSQETDHTFQTLRKKLYRNKIYSNKIQDQTRYSAIVWLLCDHVNNDTRQLKGPVCKI